MKPSYSLWQVVIRDRQVLELRVLRFWRVVVVVVEFPLVTLYCIGWTSGQ